MSMHIHQIVPNRKLNARRICIIAKHNTHKVLIQAVHNGTLKKTLKKVYATIILFPIPEWLLILLIQQKFCCVLMKQTKKPLKQFCYIVLHLTRTTWPRCTTCQNNLLQSSYVWAKRYWWKDRSLFWSDNHRFDDLDQVLEKAVGKMWKTQISSAEQPGISGGGTHPLGLQQ